MLQTRQFSAQETEASSRRKKYVDLWLNESIPEFDNNGTELKSCIESVLFINSEQIKLHEDYFKSSIFALYKAHYESSDSTLAQSFRTAICYLDETLNMNHNS